MEHEMYNAPRGQKTASGRGTEFFDVFDEEFGGGRPPPLPEVAGPQARVLRRTVEPIIESFVPVQMIDVPVPQSSMGGVLDQILQRTAGGGHTGDRSAQDLQPSVSSSTSGYSSAADGGTVGGSAYGASVRLLWFSPKRNFRGGIFDVFSQDWVQQRLGLTIQFLRVAEGGARGGLQGSLPVQNSAAVVEQIVDIPARRGLPDFLPGQGSSSSSSSRLRDDADDDFTGFFALFPVVKKVRSWARTRGRIQLLFQQFLAVFVDFLGVQFLDTVFDMPAVVHVRVIDVFFAAAHRWLWMSLCSCSDVFAVLDTVVDMPVASNDRCWGLTEQKTVVSAVAVL